MANTVSPMRGISEPLQTAATTGNGNVLAIPSSFRYHSIIIKGGAGVAAGAIQVESAESFDYAGTWSPIGGGPVTVVADSEASVDFEGVIRFLRARISTNITGGTVDVTYLGVTS